MYFKKENAFQFDWKMYKTYDNVMKPLKQDFQVLLNLELGEGLSIETLIDQKIYFMKNHFQGDSCRFL